MTSVPVPLGRNAWKRSYAAEPEVVLKNRFFEVNPTNLDQQTALLARPGSTPFTSVGSGTHRGKFTQPGFMNGDLFVADSNKLYRVQSDGTKINITSDLLGSGDISFAAMFGADYEYLFLADGLLLQVYLGGTRGTSTLTATQVAATGTLTTTGNAVNNETVTIGSHVYTWKGTLTGAADEVLVGGSADASLTNLMNAINGGTGEGTTYGTGTVAHTQVTATHPTTSTLVVTAITAGDAGNAIATTETMTSAAWGGALMSGGLTNVIASQVIKVGTTYFTWGNAAAVAAATATGSAAHPWVALLGSTDAESLLNMEKLFNFAGVRGTTYSSTLGGPNTQVTAVASGASIVLTSISTDSSANSIATTVDSGANIAWGTATLTGAGTHALSGVEIPTGNGAKAVAPLAGHVLVAQTDTDRLYWVLPGELTIGALQFATAESQPDQILDLVSTGDTVAVLGSSSVEYWYATGDSAAPFAPIQGRTWQHGIVDGTAVRNDNMVVVVGADMVVYTLAGQPARISHHGIEERIRTQLKRELSA